jgi:hypothetical protein
MASTTQANVLLIAPEFSTIAAGLWTLFLADASGEITDIDYASEGVEIIQRFLVAHWLTKWSESSGTAHQSESITDASFTRFDNDYMTSKYGQRVIELKKKYRVLKGF